jgi:hypothetical protein
VVLDTPDIDGTLRENWHRAEIVRNAADVVVAVLTQQKYNDAAVRDFFSAAVAAGKTVIVVFNMVDWPRQRERLAGWLGTFTAETRAAPAAVYAAPYDADAAAEGRVALVPLEELTADGQAIGLAERLATADFDRIKRRSMQGALAVVLEPGRGLAAWLDGLDRAAAGWRDAQRVLEQEARLRVELPASPQHRRPVRQRRLPDPRSRRVVGRAATGARTSSGGAAGGLRRAGARGAQAGARRFRGPPHRGVRPRSTAGNATRAAARRRQPSGVVR